MLQLKEKPTTVYVILPGRYMDTHARFFRLIVTSAIDELCSRPGGHRTLFVLDEFAKLENLASVAKAFSFATGYNIQMWPFLQDLPQLKAIYGEKWESFVANAGLIQFFTPTDMTTAEYIARRSGLKTRVQASRSERTPTIDEIRGGVTGHQFSYSGGAVANLPPEVSMELPADRQILFLAGVHGFNEETRKPYYRIPRLRGMYDADPFHTDPLPPEEVDVPRVAPSLSFDWRRYLTVSNAKHAASAVAALAVLGLFVAGLNSFAEWFAKVAPGDAVALKEAVRGKGSLTPEQLALYQYENLPYDFGKKAAHDIDRIYANDRSLGDPIDVAVDNYSTFIKSLRVAATQSNKKFNAPTYTRTDLYDTAVDMASRGCIEFTKAMKEYARSAYSVSSGHVDYQSGPIDLRKALIVYRNTCRR